jgi:hypothetical protein
MITTQMYKNIGVVVVVIVWWLALQLRIQSVPITNKAGSSNPAHGEDKQQTLTTWVKDYGYGV